MFNTISFVLLIVFLIVILLISVYLITRIRRANHNNNSRDVFNNAQFSDAVIADTETMYKKISSGQIRKHTLANAGEYYDSTKTMVEYNCFLDSDLMREYISERQECSYHG